MRLPAVDETGNESGDDNNEGKDDFVGAFFLGLCPLNLPLGG